MTSGRCRFLKEWPTWEISVHSNDAQISRQGRAMTYPFTFDIDFTAETARFSSTTDIPYYNTSLSQCNCYDFQERRLPCKHMYRLAAELGVIEIIRRTLGSGSPSGKELLVEIRDSGDVDSHPEQVKRLENAKGEKMAPVSVDYMEQTAIFAGSGKKPYETTAYSCTCRDFFVRRLPCKHIYRLRMELQEWIQKAPDKV